MNIYRAICLADGRPMVHADPAAVTARALDGSDPVAMETVMLFPPISAASRAIWR